MENLVSKFLPFWFSLMSVPMSVPFRSACAFEGKNIGIGYLYLLTGVCFTTISDRSLRWNLPEHAHGAVSTYRSSCGSMESYAELSKANLRNAATHQATRA